jgi:hypothetical protein
MSTLQFNAIATRILLDESFQHAMLNGQRQDCLASFQLTDQERIAILTIRSKNLHQFISELHRLMQTSGTRPLYMVSGGGATLSPRI